MMMMIKMVGENHLVKSPPPAAYQLSFLHVRCLSSNELCQNTEIINNIQQITCAGHSRMEDMDKQTGTFTRRL